MKKITGKVVSLVLALALVVTSFSANFAFASTKSVSGTVSDTLHDEIYLVNGESDKDYEDLLTWITPELDTKDHQDLDKSVEISAISHASGDTLVKWKLDDDTGNANLTVKSTTKTGKEVLSILYEDTYNNDDGDTVTVKARKDFTVYVLDEDSLIVGKAGGAEAGKELKAPDTLAQTKDSERSIAVYSVSKNAGSAAAVYTPVKVTSVKTPADTDTYADDVKAYIELSNTDNVKFKEAEDLAKVTSNEVVGTSTLTLVSGKASADAAVTNLTVTVKKITDGTVSNSSDDKYTLKTKIEKKVDVETLDSTHVYTISKKSGRIVINDKDTNVKDSELVFPDGTTSVTVDEGSIKKISGDVGELKINDDATVGTVDIDSGNVTVDGGKVGDITTSDHDGSTTGTVTVNSGKAGNIDTTDAADGDVTIYGGTAGNITSDADVKIESNDEDETVSTGKITASSIDAFADEAKVSIGDIKASADGTFLFKGTNLTLGAVDFDYRDVNANFGDDNDEFVGTLKNPANAKNAKFNTENEDTDVTVSGTVVVDTISVGSDSQITFDSNVTVDTVDGDGAMKIVAGKLYVTGSVSNTTLKLSDTTLAPGTTVFKADSDAVDEDDFETFGFTLDVSTGNEVDTFKIKTLAFAGLAINKTSSSIAKGYSETFTAAAYPGGTALPAGATIKWELDGGSDDVFTLTTSGNTAKVDVVSIDTDFASENTTTLTATLYDEDGYELDDYDAATCKITATAVPAAVSDTNNDFSVAKGSTYQFKITSSSAPTFTTGTAGVFSVALASVNGNDYYYKITAIGNVGAATGIYLNGNKLLVATVKAPAFTTDTTKDMTVKGAYTIKVTATATPTFALGTPGVFNAAFVSKTGNDYLYKITSVGAAGAKTGVYVNGVKTFVATVG